MNRVKNNFFLTGLILINLFADAQDNLSKLSDSSFIYKKAFCGNNFLNGSVYHLNSCRELFFATTDAAILTTGFLLLPQNTLNETAIAEIHASSVPAFEKYIIYTDSTHIKTTGSMSDIFVYAAFGISAGVVLLAGNGFTDIEDNAVIYAEGMLLTAGITELLKRAVQRERPYVYNPAVSVDDKVKKEALRSFPSGHTAYTSFNCFFAAELLNAYYIEPDNKILRAITWTTASALPLATGYLRTQAGEHFLTDIAAGYIIGAAAGLSVPALHRNKNIEISCYPVIGRDYTGGELVISF